VHHLGTDAALVLLRVERGLAARAQLQLGQLQGLAFGLFGQVGLELLDQARSGQVPPQGVAPHGQTLAIFHQLQGAHAVVVVVQQFQPGADRPATQSTGTTFRVEPPQLLPRHHQQAGAEMQAIVEVKLQPCLCRHLLFGPLPGGARTGPPCRWKAVGQTRRFML